MSNALDAIVASPPSCMFCGTSQGPFDVEDVYPVWTRKVLPVPIQVTRTTTEGAQPRHQNVLKATCGKRCAGPATTVG